MRAFTRMAVLACGLFQFGVTAEVWSATLVVSNTNDSGAGSLRATLSSAGSGDSILFDVGTNATITLASEIDVSQNLTIDGVGSPSLTISGNNAVRVFYIGSSTTVTLAHLTVANGTRPSFLDSGGGIFNHGSLTINACTFTGNYAQSQGGAIYNEISATLVVVNSTFAANTAGEGGAIQNWSTTNVYNSTFVGNTANSGIYGGGAIQNTGASMTVVNALFSGNSTTYYGGAIGDPNNSAHVNYALYWNNSDLNGTAPTSGSANCWQCASNGNSVSSDPLLGSLANNGGPTQTFLPASGSAAIDAGDDGTCAAGLVNRLDQRGIHRPQGSHCDIGAVEVVTRCYVDAAAIGANSGASWGNAYTDLQSALGATACGEIWVAKGLYKPAAAGNQATSFNIRSGTQLYGGFAGGEVQRTQRNPYANITVLSGDIDGDDSVDANDIDSDTSKIAGSNTHTVVLMDGTTAAGGIDTSTVLDGFTITGGYGGSVFGAGGGMFCNGSGNGHACNPILSNLVFSGNRAAFGGALTTDGESAGDSSPTLSNITFRGNYATSEGGGMFVDGGNPSGSSSPKLSDVTFVNNGAAGGGAMFTTAAYGGTSNPVISNSTFSGNYASIGGAVCNSAYNDPVYTTATSTCSPQFINVTFSGNSATSSGGAICNTGVATQSIAAPLFANVILWGDTAPSAPEVSNALATPAFYSSIVQGSGGSAIWNASFGIDDGHNLDANPYLGPLKDNGGNTQTMVPQTGSPAIDNGDAKTCLAAPVSALDQRGVTRPQGANCDIGAVEGDRVFGDGFEET